MRNIYAVFWLVVAMAAATIYDMNQPALAHKVVVFAWVEDGAVHVQGSFGSKRPAMGASVTAATLDGKDVFKGKTDDQGLCSFRPEIPLNSDLVVVLDAGTGHQGQWTLTRQEVSGLGSNKLSGKEDKARDYLEKKAVQRQKLEKGPSVVKVLLGIGIIFLIALGVGKFKSKGKF